MLLIWGRERLFESNLLNSAASGLITVSSMLFKNLVWRRDQDESESESVHECMLDQNAQAVLNLQFPFWLKERLLSHLGRLKLILALFSWSLSKTEYVRKRHGLSDFFWFKRWRQTNIITPGEKQGRIAKTTRSSLTSNNKPVSKKTSCERHFFNFWWLTQFLFSAF